MSSPFTANSHMKKVLLATRPLVPPWDEASKNFAYFLGKSIHDHALTLLGTGTPLEGIPAGSQVLPVFSGNHLNLTQKIHLFWFLFTARAKYDITHYLFTPTKTTSTLIQKLVKPTAGKTVQTLATLRDDLYSKEDLQEMLFADALVVYTDQSKQKLHNLGFTNVTRIYPGIDLTKYQLAPKKPELLSVLNITAEDFVVIYPGEYVRLGATDMLTEFCTRFFVNGANANVIFVFACRVKNPADAAKKQAVVAALTEAGVINNVRFSDTIADMPGLYNLADVVAFPVENLRGKFDVPLVIIEAYACQKPVILSDLPAFAEFSDPSFCVTIPSGSSEALAEQISRLAASPQEAKQMGEAARAFTEAHFDLATTAKEYSELYKAL